MARVSGLLARAPVFVTPGASLRFAAVSSIDVFSALLVRIATRSPALPAAVALFTTVVLGRMDLVPVICQDGAACRADTSQEASERLLLVVPLPERNEMLMETSQTCFGVAVPMSPAGWVRTEHALLDLLARTARRRDSVESLTRMRNVIEIHKFGVVRGCR